MIMFCEKYLFFMYMCVPYIRKAAGFEHIFSDRDLSLWYEERGNNEDDICLLVIVD